MLRGILFDLGDTLIDFEPMDTRAVFRAGAASTYQFFIDRGVVLPPFATYCRNQFRAVRWAYLVAKLRRREFNGLHLLRSFCVSIGAHLDDATLLDLAWLWYAPLTHHASIEPDLASTLTGLRRAGLKLGLVSNTFVAGVIHDRHLHDLGLLDLLPMRVYSSDIGYRKPDRRIFQSALERLGVKASETLFVGDLVKTDIIGARRLGMTTALKQPWGISRAHRLADFVIQRVSDLPRVVGGIQAPEPMQKWDGARLAMPSL